uniref:Uncharacterized protein n=1 Tax=Ficedula albicollis TaxID=59894 RepID=A0A803VRA9_FICAL
MSASQQFRKNNDGGGSRIESPKSPKKSLKQRIPSGANMNKGDSEEFFNQDVSAAHNLDEEELEEEEEEEEEEDENDNGDGDEDYEEEEEEEEEEDEDFTEDEKEEEELEDEETHSNEILEEEKTESKGEINQKLEYFSKAKHEGDAQCGTGDVCDDHEITKEHDEKVKDSVDTPVSFIAGSCEKFQENKTAVSPKIMNNEISCKSVPKQAVFQNLNNLQDMQESLNRKSMIEETFHRKADSSFAGSEMTDWKKEIPQPLLDSCGVEEEKSNFSDSFESGNNSWLAEKNPGPEGERPISVILEHVDSEDSEEEYEGVDDKVCKPLKQDSENLHLNEQEDLRAAFHSSTEEESSDYKEEEKDGAGRKLQTTGVEDVKNSVCNDRHEVHKASKDNSGTLPTVGAEQEEDAESPWDSEATQADSEMPRNAPCGVLLPAAERHGPCSQFVSGESDNGVLEKPNNSQLRTPTSALKMHETSPKKRQQKSDLLQEFDLEDVEDIEGEYSGSTFHMSSAAEKEDDKDAVENYGVWDKYILETTNLIEKSARENETDKAEVSHQKALTKREKSHSADKESNLKTWEERYERMWVESEKRELKTSFKNITAELKQLFGENEAGKTASLVEEIPEDGFGEELKSSHIISSPVTESYDKLESQGEFGDTKFKLGGKVPKMEIILPILPDRNSLKTNVEDTWNTDEETGINSVDNRKASLGKGEKKKMPTMETEENDNGSSKNAEEGPAYSLRHSLKSSILGDFSNILPQIRPVCASDENAHSITEMKLNKYSGCNNDVPKDCLINSNIGETETKSLFTSAQESCDVLERSLDEELKRDMERFKSKVGMLQTVFLALEKEKVQLQKEVEKEKSKERCFNMQTVAKEENVDKLNTPPGSITNQQMKEKLILRKNDCLKMEDENTTEEKIIKNFSPEESEFALNHDVAKKDKGQTLKQKANQLMSSSSGNNFRVPDDSTSSEVSQEEGRPAAKTASERNKVRIQMDVTDDLDLTHSSDTTSEDVKLPTSTYKEAVLLLEQLTVDHTGSAILLKIQNILLKYEQIIEHEKNRYAAVSREVRKLESEKEKSKLIAEETQDLKSVLAHQEVEWKSDIQSLKYVILCSDNVLPCQC